MLRVEMLTLNKMGSLLCSNGAYEKLFFLHLVQIYALYSVGRQVLDTIHDVLI